MSFIDVAATPPLRGGECYLSRIAKICDPHPLLRSVLSQGEKAPINRIPCSGRPARQAPGFALMRHPFPGQYVRSLHILERH
jgi:hypothetical protein